MTQRTGPETGETPSGTTGPDARPSRGGTDESRRRFARAGLATPLVLTLASRPVWGQTVCTASAHASGNASQHEECVDLQQSNGLGVDGWVAVDPTQYPSPYTATVTETTASATSTTEESTGRTRRPRRSRSETEDPPADTPVPAAPKFKDVFTASTLEATLDQVLRSSGAWGPLERNAIAALFDAAKATEGFPPPATIINLYNATIVPAPGDPAPDEVLAYFAFLNGGR